MPVFFISWTKSFLSCIVLGYSSRFEAISSWCFRKRWWMMVMNLNLHYEACSWKLKRWCINKKKIYIFLKYNPSLLLQQCLVIMMKQTCSDELRRQGKPVANHALQIVGLISVITIRGPSSFGPPSPRQSSASIGSYLVVRGQGDCHAQLAKINNTAHALSLIHKYPIVPALAWAGLLTHVCVCSISNIHLIVMAQHG